MCCDISFQKQKQSKRKIVQLPALYASGNRMKVRISMA